MGMSVDKDTFARAVILLGLLVALYFLLIMFGILG
jgi:hypothetical protein